MTPQEMWQAYKAINSKIGDQMDAWAFGDQPDHLADLVLKGIKIATASAYDQHLYFNESIGQVGDTSLITDSQGNAVCMIETTKIYKAPFKDVTKEHAFKEGEGDRSLAYWRQVHETLFTEWLAEIGITFTEDSLIVCEEFKVVYPLGEIV